MSPWLIATIVIMVILAVAFGVFVAQADSARVRHTQRWWSRKHTPPGSGEGPPVG